MEQMQQNALMKVPRAVAALGEPCSAKLVYSAILRGECRAIKIGTGRHVRTSPAWVMAWLNSRASGGPAGREELRHSA